MTPRKRKRLPLFKCWRNVKSRGVRDGVRKGVLVMEILTCGHWISAYKAANRRFCHSCASIAEKRQQKLNTEKD